MKKGFTLIELLAVIVVLAIILVIAVPIINNIESKGKTSSFITSAKNIVMSAETNYLSAKNKVILCDEILSLKDSDYESCSVSIIDNSAEIVYIGSGKFEGLSVCGNTKNNISVSESCTGLITLNAGEGYLGQKHETKIIRELNSYYGTLPIPTREGKTFVGWYKESSYTTKVDSTTIVATSAEHTLYAKWS